MECLELAGNGWKWLKIAGNGWKWLEWMKRLKWIDMARIAGKVWKMLEMAELAGNYCKLLAKAGNV